jgi:thioredoxin reductase
MIIGAGPAGLSAAEAAAKTGLDYIVIEKGTIANTIRQYPVGRTMFSTPNEVEKKRCLTTSTSCSIAISKSIPAKRLFQ